MWIAPALAMMSIPAMVVAAPAADVAASPVVFKSARQFADITVRPKVGDGSSEIDKPEAVAILRTRSQRVDHPTAGDRLFAEQRGVSVFIIGEWVSPAPMWEIGRRDGAMVFRTVDKDGAAGAWQLWP